MTADERNDVRAVVFLLWVCALLLFGLGTVLTGNLWFFFGFLIASIPVLYWADTRCPS